ncbi:hypothetical protein ACLKA6_008690 [Drosophila palustris]
MFKALLIISMANKGGEGASIRKDAVEFIENRAKEPSLHQEDIKLLLIMLFNKTLLCPEHDVDKEHAGTLTRTEFTRWFLENILLIGVEIDHRVKISTITKTAKSPKNGETYRLVGFVNYVGPSVTTY